VAHRVGASLVGSLALFEWVEVGLEIPAVLYQARDLADLRNLVADARALDTIGTGDLRLSPKVRLLRAEEALVDLAVMPTVTFPTAFPFRNYLGDGSVTFEPELMVSRNFEDEGFRVAANLGYRLRPETRFLNIVAGQEVSYRLGVAYSLLPALASPVDFNLSMSGATYLFAPFQTAAQTPLEALFAVNLDLWGPAQAFAGVGRGIIAGFGTPEWRAFVGVRYTEYNDDKDGDGRRDYRDVCPTEPEDLDGYEDADGCPEPDNDKDTILDVDDTCPFEPEDLDGFDDRDGCPEPDNDKDTVVDLDDRCPLHPGTPESKGCPPNDRDLDGIIDREDRCPTVFGVPSAQGCPDRDGDSVRDDRDRCPTVPGLPALDGCNDKDKDGILDHVDKCPTEPETMNGVDDQDGCPDDATKPLVKEVPPEAPRVKIVGNRVAILDKVYFDTGKATLQKRSFPLLNEVAAVLEANPQVTKVRVDGHTDAQGSDSANLKLSDARAASVRAYLVGRGIRAARLDSKGFGEAVPVATNNTKDGREANRRVEFLILEIDGQPVEQEQGATPTIERPE
jgi:outer membrane protein OmpA-like peptidoglycan-associated protein